MLSFYRCRLRLAFKWLIRAFSGYLSSEQVLLLWDRILGYDSLEILPSMNFWIFHNHWFMLWSWINIPNKSDCCNWFFLAWHSIDFKVWFFTALISLWFSAIIIVQSEINWELNVKDYQWWIFLVCYYQLCASVLQSLPWQYLHSEKPTWCKCRHSMLLRYAWIISIE